MENLGGYLCKDLCKNKESVENPIHYINFREMLCGTVNLKYITIQELFTSLDITSLWWVQIAEYVLACRSHLFVFTLHHLIIIIVQTLSEDIELIKCLSDIICPVCE